MRMRDGLERRYRTIRACSAAAGRRPQRLISGVECRTHRYLTAGLADAAPVRSTGWEPRVAA
jgi:hypothetical protein